jgi:hypothetical protein
MQVLISQQKNLLIVNYNKNSVDFVSSQTSFRRDHPIVGNTRNVSEGGQPPVETGGSILLMPFNFN